MRVTLQLTVPIGWLVGVGEGSDMRAPPPLFPTRPDERAGARGRNDI
jgi:hypothetical protein